MEQYGLTQIFQVLSRDKFVIIIHGNLWALLQFLSEIVKERTPAWSRAKSLRKKIISRLEFRMQQKSQTHLYLLKQKQKTLTHVNSFHLTFQSVDFKVLSNFVHPLAVKIASHVGFHSQKKQFSGQIN